MKGCDSIVPSMQTHEMDFKKIPLRNLKGFVVHIVTKNILAV